MRRASGWSISRSPRCRCSAWASGSCRPWRRIAAPGCSCTSWPTSPAAWACCWRRASSTCGDTSGGARSGCPAAMTATWLSTGAILIVGLTAGGGRLALPRLGRCGPGAVPPSESSDLRASKHAILKDSGVQGEGARSEGTGRVEGREQPPASGKAKGSGKTNDPNAAQQTTGKGKPGGARRPGTSKSGAPTASPPRRRAVSRARRGPRRISPEIKARPRSRRRARAIKPKGQDGRSEDKAEGKEPTGASEKGSEQDDEKSSEENPDQGDSSSSPPISCRRSRSAPWTGCRADHRRRDRDRDLRPLPLRPGFPPGPPRLDRRAAGRLGLRLGQETGEGRRGRTTSRRRRRGRSPRS